MEESMLTQSKNNFIERLKKKNIPVTWNFILIGLVGRHSLQRQICLNEVINYALEREVEGPYNKYIENIAFSEENKEYIIENILEIIKNEEDTKKNSNDLKKWELLLLENFLEELEEDPIRGLTNLTSFWSQFDFPHDSPHEVQGCHNNLTPEDYYTQKNYLKIITKHKNWINNTEIALRDSL
jgi:hypothetical protein